MIRFLLSGVLAALLTPAFINWSQDQAEEQLDKMQEAAFDTPGAEAPLPPVVFGALAAFLVGHFLLARLIFRLGAWSSFFSLILGGLAGLGSIFIQTEENDSSLGDLP